MTDFLKIAKSIVVHFAHICAYGVETVNSRVSYRGRGALVFLPSSLSPPRNSELYYCICECELSIKVGRGDIFRVS